MRQPRRRRIASTNARNTDETSKHLREFAEALRDAAQSLEETAEKMDLNGLRTLNVRCGKGAAEYLVTKILPFAEDARRKIKAYGV